MSEGSLPESIIQLSNSSLVSSSNVSLTIGPARTNISTKSIALIDSGLGGLTVLRELRQRLPQESVLYFGDTARLPYGTRTAAEIVQFTRQILTWLEQQEVKMAILACNTSSALALETIRSEFSFPVVGLILPGAQAATKQGKRIGVIATPATVASNAYPQAILELNPAVNIWQVGCPEFVDLVEQNQINTPHAYRIVETELALLIRQRIDTIVYGCTHYPLLAPVLKQVVPYPVKWVNPAVHVVAAVVRELEALGLRNHLHQRSTRFWVSGCPQRFAQQSAQWLGYTPLVEQVRLPTREVCHSAELPATLDITPSGRLL
jgi:glutamate racemase